ncbi:hypothetical protein NIES267_10820 [Calothrix parasitica NIES-267]|uniref:Uncharacterized protein n=1 Tax=Calothrix parasitica NIES-267 TaxID=1973488 RepID=A0A1Z4LK66_9CYAN|nr:hypothetical protein NIES267_10820 [Calothrix parasitica NIES-267]
MFTTDNLLSQMRTKVLELYSPVIQLRIETEADESKRKELIEQRESCRYYLHELELKDLQEVLAKMKPLEAELNLAIQSLDDALEDVENTVGIIGSIRRLSGIMVRLFAIF